METKNKKFTLNFFLIIILLTYCINSYGETGYYIITGIEKGESLNIPGRPPEELWKFIKLIDKTGKSIVKIYKRLEVHRESANFCVYIKNLTTTNIQFTLIVKLKDLQTLDPYKVNIPSDGEVGPFCERILLGGNYEAIDWGIAVYKEWKSRTDNSGRGIISYR